MLITDEEKSSAVRKILLFKSLLFVKSFNFKARVHELMANVGCDLIWVDFLYFDFNLFIFLKRH